MAIDHVQGIVGSVGDVQPVIVLTDGCMIEPTITGVLGQIDKVEESKSHLL